MPQKFIDGCHRYGWIITIVVNVAALAYFTGGLNQSVIDVRADVQILKSQVYDLGHAIRGPVTDSTTSDYQRRKDKAIGEEKKK